MAGVGWHPVHPRPLLLLPWVKEPSLQAAIITAAGTGVLWGAGIRTGLDLGGWRKLMGQGQEPQAGSSTCQVAPQEPMPTSLLGREGGGG